MKKMCLTVLIGFVFLFADNTAYSQNRSTPSLKPNNTQSTNGEFSIQYGTPSTAGSTVGSVVTPVKFYTLDGLSAPFREGSTGGPWISGITPAAGLQNFYCQTFEDGEDPSSNSNGSGTIRPLYPVRLYLMREEDSYYVLYMNGGDFALKYNASAEDNYLTTLLNTSNDPLGFVPESRLGLHPWYSRGYIWSASGPAQIPTSISASITLSGFYYVTDDVTISGSGTVVTMSPGTIISVAAGKKITVNAGAKIVANEAYFSSRDYNYTPPYTWTQANQKWSGIVLNGDGNSFSGCLFDNTSNGVQVKSNGNSFEACRFQRNDLALSSNWTQSSGFSSFSVSDCIFISNTTGIYASNASATIYGSQFLESSNQAILIYNTNISSFIRNTVKYNNTSGLAVGGIELQYWSSIAAFSSTGNKNIIGNTRGNSIYTSANSTPNFGITGQYGKNDFLGLNSNGTSLVSTTYPAAKYIYSLALSAGGENSGQIVPAKGNYWQSPQTGNVPQPAQFWGNIDYANYYTTPQGGGPTLRTASSNEAVAKSVMSASMALAISRSATGKPNSDILRQKQEMIELRNAIRQKPDEMKSVQMLHSLYSQVLTDQTDAAKEKTNIVALLEKWRENLKAYKVGSKLGEAELTLQLGGEFAMLCELNEIARNGSVTEAQAKLAEYEPFIQNKDHRNVLMLTQLSIYERAERYNDALTVLEAVKALKPDDEMASMYEAPSYNMIEWRLKQSMGITSGKEVYVQKGEAATANKSSKQTVPSVSAVKQNYPNPFNPSTNISFSLPQTGQVQVEVYNLAGQRVATVANRVFEAGEQTVSFNASNLTSGIYFYRVSMGGKVFSKKMTLVK